MSTSRPLISITDDDPAVLDSMQLVLRRAGYETQLQTSSKELLSVETGPPVLYIIDKQLAGIDGLDACRALKGRQHTAAIPVIIVSASPSVGRLAEMAGADGFIEKPYLSADLLALISRCLNTGG